ncbi:MAG: Outer membrane protein assembly factor BamB [Methanoregula sp. PtaU1.Bin006]|uniref:WD40 repeat domain-containing protein n=1 Tax=Methanoregula sp. PtaU1.Bin006 TaxID=1811681 RepID=UPI0009CDC8A6|nr:WD40 repeat domain-containing protein [Methanoregula sp. PtaU1.Bin006]OPY37217.1 MAG: Outer membrane protein assembly factor BamB [Methanoregula sp. PtaU1.Bin006]
MLSIKTECVAGIFFLIFFCSWVFPCLAIEPVWTYSVENRKIEDIAVAPDGSSVVAGAGKVLLLSGEGKILANEPFGNRLIQSNDGSTIVTEYSSTVSSTIYSFRKRTDADGHQILQKVWETQQPDKVVSFAVSDNGERIACSAGTNDLYVLDGSTGARLGNDENLSARVAISGRGTTIAGISFSQGVKLYNSRAGFIKEYDIPLSGQTNSLFIDTNGSVIVFNTGMNIYAANISNESDVWKTKNPSEVNSLAMTPAGDIIVAGTTNGTVDFYDRKQNLSWTYYSNSGTESGQAIKSVSLTQDGSRIVAGSIDGKIILFNETGSPLWIYKTKNKPIKRVAIAADGSLAVASGDDTLYAFSMDDTEGLPEKPVSSPSTPLPTVTSGKPLLSAEPGNTGTIPVSKTLSAVPKTPATTMTGYSIIHKATQSPHNGAAGIMAMLILFFIIRRQDPL